MTRKLVYELEESVRLHRADPSRDTTPPSKIYTNFSVPFPNPVECLVTLSFSFAQIEILFPFHGLISIRNDHHFMYTYVTYIRITSSVQTRNASLRFTRFARESQLQLLIFPIVFVICKSFAFKRREYVYREE